MRSIILLFLLYCSMFANEIFDLNDILEKLEQNNHRLKIHDLQIQQSQLQKKSTQNKRYGSFNIQAGYTSYDAQRTLRPLAPPISPNTPTSSNIATATLSYSVVLFDGFATKTNIDIAQIGNSFAFANKELTLAQLRYNASSLYLKALNIKDTIVSNDALIKSLQLLHEQNKSSYNLGKSSEIDLLKIENQLFNQHAYKEQLLYNLNSLKLQLGLMIGYENQFELKNSPLQHQLLEQNTPIEKTLALQVEQMQVQRSKQEIQIANSSYYPKVYFETLHTNAYADEGSDNYYQGGIYLSWMFDFGVKKNNLQLANLEKLKAHINFNEKKSEQMAAIKETQLLIAKNKTLLQTKKQELLLAQKIEEIEKVKYESGGATIADLLFYKVQTLQTLTQMHELQYNLHESIAYYTLLTAKGTIQ